MVEDKIRLINGLDSHIEDLEEEIEELEINNSKLEKRIQIKEELIKEIDEFLDSQ